MSRPSRRASQGGKAETDAHKSKSIKLMEAGATQKSGQTDLRSLWGKSKRDRTTVGAESPGDVSDSDASASKKARFWVEVPTFRPTLSHADSATAASSVTRSPPAKTAGRPRKKRIVLEVESDSEIADSESVGGDSDSSYHIEDDEDALAAAAAAAEMDSLSDAVDEISEEVDSIAAQEDDDDDDILIMEEEKPKKKTAPRKSTGKSGGGISAAARKKNLAASADAGNLPPMSDLSEMFRDMITRKPGSAVDANAADDDQDGDLKSSKSKGLKQTKLFANKKDADDIASMYPEPKGVYLAEVAKKLGGRKLRVATMCSGTESPLLALGLISREMKSAYNVPFEVEHVFSCELEPFKQAYIERNFAPPILFRDVTELGNDFATTAYGALIEVPGDVDLLVAGTSCVDYSNLNNQKKDISAKGESGNTFRGMLSWVTKHRPSIVVLENVCSAPWPKVAEHFEKIDYSATPMRFDTKDFYIPHTRTRGYLVAFRNPPKTDPKGRKAVEAAPLRWIDMVNSMQRPASSPFEAFLLSQNDPRLHQGRLELAAIRGLGKTRAPTDWGRCASRHEKCRFEEGLGTKRPWTDWRDGAVCNMPEGYWNDWANAQTERVQDLTDVSHLRAARNGFDAAYRTLVWNLSQNVDREIGSAKRPGIVPCMTPTMIPYVTNRGGPLIGIEALALQGIPADELILTRETEDQLCDLAGNAMSSTVVGVCMVAALVLASDYLRPAEKEDEKKAVAEVADAALAETGDRVEDHITGQDLLDEQPLDLAACEDTHIAELLRDAERSARHCICEGPSAISGSPTLLCQVCGHSRCDTCSNRPIHTYERHPLSSSRLDPSEFARKVKGILPMRLSVSGFSGDALDKFREQSGATIDDDDWQVWSKSVLNSLEEAEFHFRKADRQILWTMSYDAPKASLRLTIQTDRLVWLLYAKPPTTDNVNARRRKMLEQPLARLVVTKEAQSLISGEWSVLLPSQSTLEITIEGKGELIPAWEARIGLTQQPLQDANGNTIDKVKWQEKKQWTELEVKVREEDSAALDIDISGTYKLYPACGTAMENLHIRQGGDGPRVSLFLDPVRCGHPPDDPFVFALDHERLEYNVERLTIVKIDPKWRPTEKNGPQSIKATVNGRWLGTTGPALNRVEASIPLSTGTALQVPATYAAPGSVLSVSLEKNSCRAANALLMCRVPLPHAHAEKLWSSVEGRWGEIELQHKGKQAFESLAWITERLPALETLQRWSTVKLGQEECADGSTCCARCAPAQPELSWMLRQNRLVPVEDVVQAGEYERAMKQRPPPIVAQLRLDNGVGTLRVGLNIATLLHRAMAKLPSNGRDMPVQLSWRLTTNYQAVETAFFRPKKLFLKSNKQDVSYSQPPNFRKFLLRPEQLRSLTWMLAQERPEANHSFIEEEIAEATLGALGWRAEARAARPVMVRGGVLADEVGYGKTAITLALIDVARSLPKVELPAKKGKLALKGTLVVVPAHLTKQWEGEINKFLGQGKHNYNVVKILDLSSLNNVTVSDMIEADIIIIALSVFKSPIYWSNLAGFAAAGTLPNGDQATRHFVSRLDEVLHGLDAQTERIQQEDGVKAATEAIELAFQNTAEERKKAQATKDAFILSFGKKRLTGAAYLAMQEEDAGSASKAKKPKAKTATKAEREHSDPWMLKAKSVKQNWTKMQSPPLHMFNFERVVIDEFTYIDHRCHSAVTTLAANNTWVLSGTPPVSDFAAVRGIAEFLHVHLGIEDNTEGTEEDIKRRRKGQTAAEAFHSFRETRTASWHAARYQVAQRFLDTFVRQNVAEIDEIPSAEHVISITLPAAEHAIYLELDHHINSLQGMTKKIMKSAKGARGDRQLRLSDALGNSADPREALIKRCAHFDMELETTNVGNASEACERIVETRTKQRDACIEDLRYTLAEALELYLFIKNERKGYSDPKTGKQEHKTSHFAEYLKMTFGDAGNGDDEATRLHRDIITSEGCTWKDGNYEVDKNVHKKAVASRRARDDGEGGNIRMDMKIPVDELKWALREQSHVLRKLATELVGRTRSLRYFTAVRDVQRSGETSLPACQCGKDSWNGGTMAILSACGHTGCTACLNSLAMHGYECPHEGCRINLESHQVIPASTLGREEKSGRFGAKLLQMVALIRSIPKDERILIFVQFDDLLIKIKAALKAARIGTIVIQGTAKQQADNLDRFQNLGEDDSERVLILNVAAASASGANLTLANHVIFVHPVHYPEPSNDRFIATETQAIGRIRRYGQKRKCHVYRLITCNSVDENIMVERTGLKPLGNYTVDAASFDMNDAIVVDDDDEEDEPRRKPFKRAAASRKRKATPSEDESVVQAWSETPEPVVKKSRKKRLMSESEELD